MSKIKKLIALTLALAMVLSVSAFAGSYKADTYADADKINEDCESAVELLYALDIMVGDGKNFNPESAVTRAEMAKMIYVILNYGKDDKAATYTGAKFFTDVEAGYWAEGYINYCAATKLIAGRGDGTFGPTDAVTCAEAAKMLLTAIGYSAEHRGYTGANWDKNVLSDAAILGLLKNYKYNTNLTAPRQWVAVMIKNALGCYTFGTMAPNFAGLLVSGVNVNGNGAEEYTYDTMGEKYYGLAQYTGYLYATPNAWVDRVSMGKNANGNVEYLVPSDGTKSNNDNKDYSTADKYVMFSDGDTADYLILKTSAVGVQDLGQEFHIIYKAGTNTIYSIALTGDSVVAEELIKDVTCEIDHGDWDNDRDNPYVFTVGAFEGKFNSGSVKVAELWSKNEFTWNTYNAKTVYQNLGSDRYTRTDVLKVIDKDGDGDADYALYTAYDYGKVTAAKTNKYHGDYVTVAKLTDATANVTYYGDPKLYLDEVVICDDELEKGDYVKYTWNYDDMCIEMEELTPVASTYEHKDNKGNYCFDGADYQIADNGIAVMAGRDTDEEYVIVTDDTLLVDVYTEEDYMSLDDLNGKLALVIGVTTRFDTGFYSDTNAIRFMTIEGGAEYIDAPYYMDVNKAADKQGANALAWADIEAAFLGQNGKEADLTDYAKLSADQAQLYILRTKGTKVYLEKLPEDVIAKTEDPLSYELIEAEATLDVEEGIFYTGTLAATDIATTVETENTYFVGMIDKYGDITYTVQTLDELGAVTASVEHTEAIYYDAIIDEILGGYVLIDGTKLNGDGASGYAWISSKIWSNDDGKWCDLMTKDETLEKVDVVATEGTTLTTGGLYWYEYDLDDECYVLSAIDWDNEYNNTKIVKTTSTSLVFKQLWDGKMFQNNVKDYPIALEVELWELNDDNEEFLYNTYIIWTTIADLNDGLVTVENSDGEDVVVKVVDAATMEDPYVTGSISKLVHTEDEELVFIDVTIKETTKQVQAQ